MTETQLPDKIAGIDVNVIDEIQVIQDQHSLDKLVDMSHLQKSFTIAQGIGRFTKLFMANEQIVNSLMYLQGKKLGFRTDKDYDAKTVVECAVEALMRGLQLTGNQFNIIAGNLYVPKEGFEHLMDTLDGFSDFFITWGEKTETKGTAKVNFKCEWIYKNNPETLEGWVPVRVNSGMGVDAIYGKAERKVMARVYKKITKSAAYFDERDKDDFNVVDTTAREKPRPAPQLTEGDGKLGGVKEPGNFKDH